MEAVSTGAGPFLPGQEIFRRDSLTAPWSWLVSNRTTEIVVRAYGNRGARGPEGEVHMAPEGEVHMAEKSSAE
jgi:hypothetical protein